MKGFRTLLSLALILFLHLGASGQGQFLQIISPKDQKEITIKEGKRIRLLTRSGQRIAGRLFIKDLQTIIIKGQEIPLAQIEKIKRDGLLYHILTGAVLVLATSVATAVLYWTYSQEMSVLVFFGGVYSILKTPNIIRGYKQSEGAEYRIISRNYKGVRRAITAGKSK